MAEGTLGTFLLSSVFSTFENACGDFIYFDGFYDFMHCPITIDIFIIQMIMIYSMII